MNFLQEKIIFLEITCANKFHIMTVLQNRQNEYFINIDIPLRQN